MRGSNGNTIKPISWSRKNASSSCSPPTTRPTFGKQQRGRQSSLTPSSKTSIHDVPFFRICLPRNHQTTHCPAIRLSSAPRSTIHKNPTTLLSRDSHDGTRLIFTLDGHLQNMVQRRRRNARRTPLMCTQASSTNPLQNMYMSLKRLCRTIGCSLI